jgi:hypothetical protein
MRSIRFTNRQRAHDPACLDGFFYFRSWRDSTPDCHIVLMIVLIVLVVSWLAFRGVGAAGLHDMASWHVSARYALVVNVRLRRPQPISTR